MFLERFLEWYQRYNATFSFAFERIKVQPQVHAQGDSRSCGFGPYPISIGRSCDDAQHCHHIATTCIPSGQRCFFDCSPEDGNNNVAQSECRCIKTGIVNGAWNCELIRTQFPVNLHYVGLNCGDSYTSIRSA